MLKRYWIAVFVLLFTLASFSQTGGKKKVNSQADLPRFSYSVTEPASQLVQADDATFNSFMARVSADLDSIFSNYEIDDKSTMRTLLNARLDAEQLGGQYDDGLKTVDQLRALEEKPAAKLTTGLFSRAWLQAAIDTRSTSGPEFEKSFTQHYRDAIDPLPWDVVQDSIKVSYRDSRLVTRALVIGGVQTELDPAFQKSGALDNLEAWELLSDRDDLKSYIALDAARGAVLKQYIAAHNVVKPDIWEAREVTLTAAQKLSPVLVGIWDSGIDVSIFPDQVFTDPKPTASGTHGLAFDDRGGGSKSWTYPLTPEQQKAYPVFRELIEGFFDIENGVDSPQADAVEKKFKTLSPDQMHQMDELNKVLGFYVHGTHCAGIAVRGNPAARLVVARFNDQLPDLPFPPSDEWAKRLGADFQQMSDYFRTRKVRVVNMSWGDDPQEFETWISKTGGGADPAERKKRAAELFAIWREAIETAIKNSPDTLFITAAGNSDSDTGFIEDVPSSLQLPNLIAVGAVNQAGDETSFTSYGKSVVVDADGYHVESFVPGGTRLKLSGTSMASPGVVNLAAKLFALDPALTPAQVVQLIKDGATASEDGRRHLIDEKKSVELLKAQAK